VRDLAGATIILTRAVADNAPLEAVLRARGAAVLELPCVAVRPLGNDGVLRSALRELRGTDALVVTSRAGIGAVVRALSGAPLDAPLAVVGPATAAAARRAGLVPSFVASRPDGATLGRELPLPRGVVLLARSDQAGDELPAILRRRGAEVREVVAYRTETPTARDLSAAWALLADGGAIACFASASAVDGFVELVGDDLAAGVRPVAFGPKTAARIRARLRREPAVAASPEPRAVARAIARALGEVADGARQ